MEDERKRPYSVLTRNDLIEKMNKQIDEISEVFLLSKSDSTVLLMFLQWDSLRVSERLSENKEKLLSESGLKSLRVSESGDKEEYDEKYVLKSYIEENKFLMIKPCPASDCEYFIEFFEDEKDDEEHGLNVVCLCGHTFCWRCKLESHRPVTCSNASDWLSTVLASDDYPSRSWILTNTKPNCPNCRRPVDLSGAAKSLRFLTCTCKSRFCWKCMSSEESHKNELGYYKACLGPQETPITKGSKQMSSSVDCWRVRQTSMKKAKRDLKAFDKQITENPSFLTEEDIRIVREGLLLVVQCRQVLKWTCAYDYFHTEYEVSKKVYLRFLQGNATANLEGYLKKIDEIRGALFSVTYVDLGNLRDRLTTATSNTGNYFYHFIKSLQDGLVDVKVNSYDGLAGQFWYCDRCTYGNTWLDKECKMCCDSTASTMEELSGLSFN